MRTPSIIFSRVSSMLSTTGIKHTKEICVKQIESLYVRTFIEKLDDELEIGPSRIKLSHNGSAITWVTPNYGYPIIWYDITDFQTLLLIRLIGNWTLCRTIAKLADEAKAGSLFKCKWKKKVFNRSLIFPCTSLHCTLVPIWNNIENTSIWPCCKSNWTEWSTIQGVIARVISKLDEREARGWFEITSTITPWLYDTRSNY